MSKITDEILQQIREVYQLDKQCVLDRSIEEENGWLSRTLREVKVDSLAKDITGQFIGGDRGFIVALAEFLIEKKLIIEPIKSPALSELDFIDRMQDRVV